jgi:4-amino-4-deoxy-L-arabinose transferase-like glycosyltransferase
VNTNKHSVDGAPSVRETQPAPKVQALVNPRHSLAIVVLFALLVCIPWLERPFHTRGEPREALVAQAMLATGNWISPPAYDGAVPSKPPFSHWLMSILSLPTGQVTEASARLPSALAFVVLVAGFCIFVSRRLSNASAVVASLILLSTSEWFRAASTCRVDTILAASMAGALLALFAWWERGYKGVPLVAIVLTTCATLTKGPIGLVLPLGIFSVFCWVQSRFSFQAVVGIVLRAIMVGLPVIVLTGVWYLLGYLERGDEFIQKVMYENVQRFSSTMADEPHKHSVWYLLGMLMLGVLPWTIPCIRLGNARAVWKGLLRSRIHEVPPLLQFSWIASLSIVLFFCIPSSKRSVYLLPAYPFIAIILEQLFREYEQVVGQVVRLLARATTGIVLLLTCVMIVMYCTPVFGISLDRASLVQSFTPLKSISLLAIIIALALPLRESLRTVWSKPVGQLAVSILCAVVWVSCFAYDTIAWQLSPKRWIFSHEFRTRVAPENYERFYSFGSEAYGASFYLQKPFSRITSQNAQEGAVVFLEARKQEELAKMVTQHIRELYRYSSGVEGAKKDIIVVQLVASKEQMPSITTDNPG